MIGYDFDAEEPYAGRPGPALDTARQSFLPLGFAITEQAERRLALTGRGMMSSNQSPLCGATTVRFEVRDHAIRCEAELGGVRSMTRFLLWFPLLLDLVLVAVFVGVWVGTDAWRQSMPLWALVLLCVGPVAPWPVLGPLMARWIRRRTEQALTTALRNMAQAR